MFGKNDIISNLKKTAVELTKFLEYENNIMTQGILPSDSLIIKKNDLLDKLSDHEFTLKQYIKVNTIDKSSVAFKSLIDCMMVMKKAMERNEVLLNANIEFSERIIEIYKAKKIEKCQDMFGYNQQGKREISDNLEDIVPDFSINNKI